MKILFATSEVVPYSKTGGLGDVSGALPDALAARGHQVVVLSPLHRAVRRCGRPLTPLGKTIEVLVRGRPVRGELEEDKAVEGARRVFVACDPYFDRDGLYGTADGDHADNAERFSFFSQAVLAGALTLGFYPDVIHVNDWQTALIPVYLKTTWAGRYGLRGARTLLTVHNLGYQGIFDPSLMETAGLPPSLFNWKELEFHGSLSFLKGGLVFADHLSTVSRTYAEEIQTESLGHGLAGVLRERRGRLTGIVNGIDYDDWNPAAGRYLAAAYDVDDLEGKAICKRALQEENGLDPDPAVPLIGMITRLAEQKGIDLVVEAFDEILALGFQVVVLGTGDAPFHDALSVLAAREPGRVGVHLEFSNPMAHRIEAGADVFLMPSRYEPCGLTSSTRCASARCPSCAAPVAGGHDRRRDSGDDRARRGDRLPDSRAHRGEPRGDARASRHRAPGRGRLGPPPAHRHAPGLVLGPERRELRRPLRDAPELSRCCDSCSSSTTTSRWGTSTTSSRRRSELAYRPYLEEMERFPALPFGLHVSGPLLEWLEKHDAALLDRIAKGVDDGRIEVIGGGFGEPILPMIPHRDRIGQIVALSDWIERRLGTRPRGAWLSERVWEAGLASSLAEAGIEYTFLDDSHFLAAGRAETELRGCFTVEDGGKLVRVFPIAERLRYEIPFATVDHVLRHLREEAARGESPVLCYADDGEKFGIWPETHEHVYENGWLRAFLEALVEAEDDVRVVSPGEAVDTIPPVGRVYLPDASYREMNEWTLPIPARRRYEKAAAELEETRTTAEARGVLRGGVWRNFLVHYPESNLMVSRMLRASDRVADLPEGSEARLDLYRGQCNCAYWHGIFGGLYLPHLRSAVYRHLLRADRLADAGAPPIRVDLVDYDRDGMDEVVLETPDLSAVIAPGRGGHLIDLSSRRKAVNLLNVLARRPEYEQEELDRAPEADPAAGDGTVKTIHHAAVEDVEGLREHLVFDEPSLESLMDRLYDTDGVEVPGFAAARYEVERAEVDDDGAVLDLSTGTPGPAWRSRREWPSPPGETRSRSGTGSRATSPGASAGRWRSPPASPAATRSAAITA
jgi:ADP-glucose type glycogen/starch synthase